MTALTKHSTSSPRSRVAKRLWLGAAAAASATMLAAAPASAQETSPGDYVTTTTATERSLDVSAFAPACIRDVPYINYTIVPVGFVPTDGSATLRIFDRHGAPVDTLNVTSLSGSFIYPGAKVDGAGNATDWPGWKEAADGSWIPDESDAILRQGLTIEVTVNPTATATVSYPAATSACANPAGETSAMPGQVCVPGDATGSGATGSAAGAGSNSGVVGQQSGDPSQRCETTGTLPQTGSNGIATPLTVGAVSLLAGGVALATARKRRHADAVARA